MEWRGGARRWEDRLPALGFGLLCLIWGTTMLAIKAGLDSGLPPIWFATVRFAISALALGTCLPLLPRKGGLVPRDWLLTAPVGAIIAVNFGLVFWGEQHVSSGMAGLLVGTQPLSTALLSRLLGGGPIGLRLGAGLALGLVGVGLLVGDVAAPGRLGLLGQGSVLAGVTIYAVAVVITGRWLGHLHPARLAFSELSSGTVLLVLWALAAEGAPALHWTAAGAVSVAYLAVMGSGVGLVLSFWLIGRIGARRFSLYAYVTPAVAVAVGAVGLGEPVTWDLVAGGGLVLAALAVAMGAPAEPRRRPPATPDATLRWQSKCSGPTVEE